MNITQEYFDDVLAAVNNLRGFTDSLASDPEYGRVFNELVMGGIRSGDRIIEQAQEKIPILALADVVRCYNWLRREKNSLYGPEGLGIILYVLKWNGNDENCTFYRMFHYSDILAPSITDLMDNIQRSNQMADDLLAIEFTLRAYNQTLRDQYIVLMYRFMSLVAKSDGTVTPEEARWLNRIVGYISTDTPDPSPSGTSLNPSVSVSVSGIATHSGAIDELNCLIGLERVKEEVSTLVNFIRIQKMREEQGLKIPPLSYHCVFTGNPGTGKTTVARIVAKIYKELGILTKGHLIETDRSGLIAEYVGQTAAKTNKLIDDALDGILFIDEAYALVSDGPNDYGKEAIATLLKRMEDNRDRLVVILAGYTDQMRKFIDANPGLQSRFNRYIEFDDYTADELYQIFMTNALKYEYKLSPEADVVLRKAMEDAVAGKDKNFGNGRFVRNLFEKVIELQANRLSSVGVVSGTILSTILPGDIIAGLEKHNSIAF